MKWKEYCGRAGAPTQDPVTGYVNGAWGEALTAACISEHQNQNYGGDSSDSGSSCGSQPAGAVMTLLQKKGHGAYAEVMDKTEQATHQALQTGQPVPVFQQPGMMMMQQPGMVMQQPPNVVVVQGGQPMMM